MKSRMESKMSSPVVIGVDIGKEIFHLVGFGADGKIAFRRRIRRLGLKDAFEKLPPCIVGMEACLSAHFVSRTLRALGHEPRIIPAIYVKPFVKGQKNDYNDAEAIAEAALRPNLRFVQEKSQDQLDLQACHRVRSRLVSRRTATINQIRAFLIEQGIAVRSGPRALRKSLFAILENRKEEISPRTARLIRDLHEDWCCLDERIETDEVGRAKRRALGMRHRFAGNGVYVFGRKAHLQHEVDGRHHPVHADTISDEVGRVFGENDPLAQGVFAEPAYGSHGLGRRLRSGHELEELHVADRVEKMHHEEAAAERLGAPLHHLGNRKTARVRGDNRGAADDRLEPRE